MYSREYNLSGYNQGASHHVTFTTTARAPLLLIQLPPRDVSMQSTVCLYLSSNFQAHV